MDGYRVTLRQYILRKIRHLELWHSDVGNRNLGVHTISWDIGGRCYEKG